MTGVVEDPSHRHGYDRDSLMDWRKALPARPAPGPMTVDEALNLATRFGTANLNSWRNEVIVTLAAEVRRLRGEAL